MTEPSQLAGGCACGAVRYRLASAPFDAGYCHCRICQLTSGAPVLAFATTPIEDFVITQGAPKRRRSSESGERWFCGDCGAQLAMRVDHQPGTIDFTLASLDTPDLVEPGFEIWTGSEISWLENRRKLPRFIAFRPHTRGLTPTT